MKKLIQVIMAAVLVGVMATGAMAGVWSTFDRNDKHQGPAGIVKIDEEHQIPLNTPVDIKLFNPLKSPMTIEVHTKPFDVIEFKGYITRIAKKNSLAPIIYLNRFFVGDNLLDNCDGISIKDHIVIQPGDTKTIKLTSLLPGRCKISFWVWAAGVHYDSETEDRNVGIATIDIATGVQTLTEIESAIEKDSNVDPK